MAVAALEQRRPFVDVAGVDPTKPVDSSEPVNAPKPGRLSRLPAALVAMLPRKRMAAGFVFYDDAERVLLVETSYKQTWDVPGGIVEAEESPWSAARRELAEELGWQRPTNRLLVIDYLPTSDGRPEGVMFLFDGGPLDEATLNSATFADGEIVAARLCTLDEARDHLSSGLHRRLSAALAAIRQDSVVLCERGIPVN